MFDFSSLSGAKAHCTCCVQASDAVASALSAVSVARGDPFAAASLAAAVAALRRWWGGRRLEARCERWKGSPIFVLALSSKPNSGL